MECGWLFFFVLFFIYISFSSFKAARGSLLTAALGTPRFELKTTPSSINGVLFLAVPCQISHIHFTDSPETDIFFTHMDAVKEPSAPMSA